MIKIAKNKKQVPLTLQLQKENAHLVPTSRTHALMIQDIPHEGVKYQYHMSYIKISRP